MMQGMPETLAQRPTPFEASEGIAGYAPPGDFRHYVNSRIKIRDDCYQTLNLIFLVLVIALQLLIIFSGVYAQFIWPWWRLRQYDPIYQPDKHIRYKKWHTMSALQMHRTLHQLLGRERWRWRGKSNEIPTTDPNFRFVEYYDDVPLGTYVPEKWPNDSSITQMTTEEKPNSVGALPALSQRSTGEVIEEPAINKH